MFKWSGKVEQRILGNSRLFTQSAKCPHSVLCIMAELGNKLSHALKPGHIHSSHASKPFGEGTDCSSFSKECRKCLWKEHSHLFSVKMLLSYCNWSAVEGWKWGRRRNMKCSDFPHGLFCLHCRALNSLKNCDWQTHHYRHREGEGNMCVPAFVPPKRLCAKARRGGLEWGQGRIPQRRGIRIPPCNLVSLQESQWTDVACILSFKEERTDSSK